MFGGGTVAAFGGGAVTVICGRGGCDLRPWRRNSGCVIGRGEGVIWCLRESCFFPLCVLIS